MLNHLAGNVTIYDYADFKEHLLIHAKSGTRAWIDPAKTSYNIIQYIDPFCKILYKESPVIYFKAFKNKTELSCLLDAHIRDGVAMVNFLYWLEKSVPTGKVTELSAESKLEEFRQQN